MAHEAHQLMFRYFPICKQPEILEQSHKFRHSSKQHETNASCDHALWTYCLFIKTVFYESGHTVACVYIYHQIYDTFFIYAIFLELEPEKGAEITFWGVSCKSPAMRNKSNNLQQQRVACGSRRHNQQLLNSDKKDNETRLWRQPCCLSTVGESCQLVLINWQCVFMYVKLKANRVR